MWGIYDTWIYDTMTADDAAVCNAEVGEAILFQPPVVLHITHSVHHDLLHHLLDDIHK